MKAKPVLVWIVVDDVRCPSGQLYKSRAAARRAARCINVARVRNGLSASFRPIRVKVTVLAV